MSYFKKFMLGFFILLAPVALFMSAMVPEKEAVAAAGSQPEEMPYSAHGPHSVGARNMVIDGETPLEITVWYPALPSDSNEAAITYPYEIKLFAPLGKTTIAAFEGQAAHNAPYDLSTGPYPLVILSPGFGLSSITYAWLAEHLASYGFIVVSPDHNEQMNPSLLWQATIARPQDILTVLAFIDEQVETGGEFAGLIDSDDTAVIGHSYGGYTALAAGGARLDTAGLEAVCQTTYETNDPIVFQCDALLPHVADMAELAGLDSIPEGLWPAWSDSRVSAVVALAGDAVMFDQAGLAEITVPVMAIGGTGDKDAPYMWGTYPAYEFASSSRKIRIALDGAAHMVFTDSCDAMRRFMKVIPYGFCSDPAWDKGYAHDLINHWTTAFLLAELKQDVNAAATLAPDAATFPDVTYEAQGY